MNTPTATVLTALFGDKPYFAGGTFGFQGDSRRHMFMACALQAAIPKDRPVRILEVGSWVGSSALTWAQAIRRFSPHGGAITCVDAWAPFIAEGDLAKGGAYSEFEALCETEIPFELFRHNTKSITGAVTLEIKRGKSAEVLKGLEKGAYDLVYIDGSHYYDAVMADLTLGSVLVRDGGIFCGDDLEAQVGQVDAAFVERSIKEDFVSDPATGLSFHPGVALACQRFFGRVIPVAIGFFYTQKTGATFSDVSLGGLQPIIPDHFNAPMKAACHALLDTLNKR